jgi:hypothetical protein
MRNPLGIALFLSLASIANAGVLDLGTFPVAGSGSFACDMSDAVADYSFGFSGSNANYMIYAASTGLGGSNPRNLLFPSCGSYVGENTVLADTNPPSLSLLVGSIFVDVTPAGSTVPAFYEAGTFQLGNGGGYLDIYDDASALPGNPANLIATAELIGYVTVDSVQTTEPYYPSWNGTFQITPDAPGTAPEPGSGLLLGAAALAGWLLKPYIPLARG